MFLKNLLNKSIYNGLSQTLMRQRGILRNTETISDAFSRVINAISEVDQKLYEKNNSLKFQKKLTDLVYNGTIVLGTPILTNAGRPAQVTSACTVLPIHVTQGQADYTRFEAESLQMLGHGLGTGYDLSHVHDPVGALNTLNDILNKMNAQFIADKKRPVASMATLRADHPHILAFIRAKKHADFSTWRFNISVFLDDALMVAAEQQKPWHLKDHDGNIVGEINAALLLREVAEIAHYCGEPGILFRDRLEYDNPTPNWRYQSTAPCAELAMAPGDACQFSYLNLSHFVHLGLFDRAKFAESIQILTRLLDNSVEYTLMQQNDADVHLPLVREKRRIGVSITGFADLLIKLNVPYDHPQAVILAHQISELLDFNSKKASVTLAQSHGPFPCFSESRYQDHDWVRRKSSKTTGIVSANDWEQLYQDIEQQGLRNATTTSIPPSGTSSTIANISKSLEPHFSFKGFNGKVIPLIETIIQHHFKGKEQAELMAHVAEHGNFPEKICLAWPYLKTSCQINPSAHLDIQQAFQCFLDDSVSKTINMHNKTKADDVEDIIWGSYKKGLKGVAIFRDNCLAERQIPQRTKRFFDQASTPRDDKHDHDEVKFTT